MKFANYLGIDYSGAQTPDKGLVGIRVYLSREGHPTEEIRSPIPAGRSAHWSRDKVRRWLVDFLRSNPSTLVGIDHGLSVPDCYFKGRSLNTWRDFLLDLDARWPELATQSVDKSLRHSPLIADYERANLLRLCETWIPGPTSVFRTVGQGSVGKSTLSGLAQLRQLLRDSDSSIQVWPFDGWSPDQTHPVIAEVYPSLWRRRFTHTNEGDIHQRDALAVAQWLKRQAEDQQLDHWFEPALTPEEKDRANREGWILGVR